MQTDAARLTIIEDADVPVGDAWLGPAELEVLGGLRFDRRRSDWRRGRWAAKRSLATRFPSLESYRIEIVADAQGAPEVRVDRELTGDSISLSHRGGLAVCALAPDAHPIGCDMEHIEPRSDAFVQDFFCEAERERYAAATEAARPLMANLIWSAKESVLKALRIGLRRDTRSIEVVHIEDAAAEWGALRLRDQDTDGDFYGWWCRHAEHLVTVVATVPLPRPSRGRPVRGA